MKLSLVFLHALAVLGCVAAGEWTLAEVNAIWGWKVLVEGRG